MKKQFILLSLVAVGLMSCNSSKKKTETITDDNGIPAMQSIDDTTPTSWELVMLDGASISQNDAEKKIHFQLNAADKTVTGFSGCNTFRGSYKLEEGNRISFSQMASTRMACPDTTINESEILKALEQTDNYTFNDGKLSLNVGRRAPLAIFKKVPMENIIVEKYWKLKTLDGTDITMVDNQEREIYFTLKNDGRVTGFSGCNGINGEYNLEKGNRIRFKNMAATLKACPDMDLDEQAVLDVFNTADNYTINGDILHLNIGRRAPLAVFEAVYMQ